MPWYWSDDLAKVLVASGRLDSDAAATLSRSPVAYRRVTETVEDAAVELAEDGEIPLAA